MNTIRIRIALAIDPYGNWNASGWKARGKEATDKAKREDAITGLETNEFSVFWIEADIPVPEIQTIEEEVKR